MGASHLRTSAIFFVLILHPGSVWTACAAKGLSMYLGLSMDGMSRRWCCLFTLSLILLWPNGTSGRVCHFLESVDETFLSGVAGFFVDCVVLLQKDQLLPYSRCLYSYRQRLMTCCFCFPISHGFPAVWLFTLLFSHIEWFLGTFRWEC